MPRKPRIHYTETDKALMWDRWRAGESLHAIAKLFDRHHPSIQGVLARTGGIRPPACRRSRLALSIDEREEISRNVVAGHSIRRIAVQLGRAPSTISRELHRNGGRLRYRASKAALNNFNKSLSIEFSEQGFVFVVLHPGWVRTDMTSDRATYSTDESAEALFELITELSQDDNGRFYDLHGESIAW